MEVETLYFRTVEGAVEFLRSEGFLFQGAPNRWKKDSEGKVLRADIHISGARHATVVIYRPGADA